MAPVDTLSELKGVFNHFLTLNNNLTRRVKYFVHVTLYYSLVNDTDDYKISYDTKTLERHIDVEDMFRWRTNIRDRCTYLLQVRVAMSRICPLMLSIKIKNEKN